MWTLGDRGSIRVPTRAQEHRVAAVWLIYDGHLIGRQREAARSKSDEFCADGQAEIDAHLSENSGRKKRRKNQTLPLPAVRIAFNSPPKDAATVSHPLGGASRAFGLPQAAPNAFFAGRSPHPLPGLWTECQKENALLLPPTFYRRLKMMPSPSQEDLEKIAGHPTAPGGNVPALLPDYFHRGFVCPLTTGSPMPLSVKKSERCYQR